MRGNKGDRRPAMIGRFGQPFLIPLALLALLALAGCGRPASSQGTAVDSQPIPVPLEQIDRQAAVTVRAMLVNPLAEFQQEKSLIFQVDMDTHSVDLTVYDITGLAVLETGGKKVKGTWQPVSEDSHHRTGLLRYPLEFKEGPGVSKGQPVTLIFPDVNGVTRTFRWEGVVVRL